MSILAMAVLMLHTWHAIYVSVTEINYEVGQLTVKVKVFTDDLEDGILNATQRSVKLRSDEELTRHKSLIHRYISSHLSLVVNNTKKPLEMLRVENEGDATWSYFKTGLGEEIQTLEVHNNILTELFSTQANIVTVNISGDKRFFRLSKSDDKELLTF